MTPVATPVITSGLLAAIPGLVHGHSTRDDGSLGRDAAQARDRFLTRLGAPATAIVVPHQVHQAHVHVCAREDAGRGRGDRPAVPTCDGLISVTPGPVLFAQGADCPLLLIAPRHGGAVAVVHSGWRGTVARIGRTAVRGLAARGHAPESLCVAVFPGIGPCCFEVGPEVTDAFEREFGPRASAWSASGGTDSQQGADRRLLDLSSALRATFLDEGLAADAVDVVPGCTACGTRFWSHRASAGRPERHGLVAYLTA